jgi:hypothetical protein
MDLVQVTPFFILKRVYKNILSLQVGKQMEEKITKSPGQLGTD